MTSSCPSSLQISNKKDDSWIPEGYVLLLGPDDEKYVVPEFMVPALNQDYHSKNVKEDLKVSSSKGTVSIPFLIESPASIDIRRLNIRRA